MGDSLNTIATTAKICKCCGLEWEQGFDGYCFVCYCWQKPQMVANSQPEFGWHRNIYRCFAEELVEAEELVAQLGDDIDHCTLTSLILNSINSGGTAADTASGIAGPEVAPPRSGSELSDSEYVYSRFEEAVVEPILHSYFRAGQSISGDVFSPPVSASPPRLVTVPKGSVELRSFELEGHDVIIAPDRWSIDGEWVRGGNPILMIQAAISSFSYEAEMAPMTRVIKLHDRLVGTAEQGEIEHKARILNEELSLRDSLLLSPRLSAVEGGYQWGEFHLDLSFLALEKFAESWYGLAGKSGPPDPVGRSLQNVQSNKSVTTDRAIEEKAIELRAACMAATGLGRRACKLSTPAMRSFRFLREIVDASDQITAHPNHLLIKGNSGQTWKIVADQIGFGSQIWKVLHISDEGNSESVCIHAERKQHLPLGDQLAAVALALVDDGETAKRIQTVAKAMNNKSRGTAEIFR